MSLSAHLTACSMNTEGVNRESHLHAIMLSCKLMLPDDERLLTVAPAGERDDIVRPAQLRERVVLGVRLQQKATST